MKVKVTIYTGNFLPGHESPFLQIGQKDHKQGILKNWTRIILPYFFPRPHPRPPLLGQLITRGTGRKESVVEHTKQVQHISWCLIKSFTIIEGKPQENQAGKLSLDFLY